MTVNLDTVIPFNIDDCEDVDYQQKRDSVQEFTEYWRKSQEQLNQFREVWRQDYLMALRENLPLSHKESQSQISRQPKIGEIVLVKDDNLPHRLWKLTLIKEYILSKDGQIRSVIIQLPNKQLVSRAINHLFPLEIQATQSEDIKNEAEVTINESVASGSIGNSQPLRKATDQACKRITKQLNDHVAAAVFSFPWEYHGTEME